MKASGISTGNVHPLPASQTKPDPFLPYSDSLRKSKLPIIIDNGSYQCKTGWATEEKPSLIFKNHIAKHRGKKENETQVGNDIKNIEVVRWLLKTQFDRDVVTQFDVQEVIYDYIFSHLGINTDGCVEHPILLTEAVCNPSYSRQLMSELLFECYQVPQVAYGVDSLFSFYYNRNKDKGQNGLIISCGYHNCHVLPVLKRRLDIQNCKRINVGGCHMIGYFHRTLQLKYPVHMSAITPSRAENLLHRHMHFSKDYGEDLEKWADDKYYEQQVKKIQLPFTPLPGSVTDTGVGKFEKCHAILRRVQAMKIKRRAEKLALDEERLQELLSVQELLEDEDDEAILALQELNYSSAEELQAGIKQLNCSIRKAKNNIAAQQGDDSQDSPLKHWCEELELKSFSDTESWIAAVHQKRKELQESRIKLTSERAKSKGLVEFGSSKPPDFHGGVLGKQEEVQNFNDYISDLEERKERIGILDEISAEYNREFSKTEHSFSFSLADYYQLHIGVEKIKMPEIIFQPSLIGSDQAGLVETVEMVFDRYNLDQQQILAQNIFLTGGCASIPFLRERIEAELQSIRPFQSTINVYLAKDPVLDSWKGARLWSLTGDNISKYSVSRPEYEEKGADYFKEHHASNWCIPMPQPVQKGILVGDNSLTVKAEQKV